MTVVRLSGANSLQESLGRPLLGQWVASSPLAWARWSEATDVGYSSLIRTKQVKAAKQYASFVFPAPGFIGLLMDLNVTKTVFCHLSEFMTRLGIDYTAAKGHTFPRPIPTRQAFLEKDMAKPLELRPPVNVDDPPASGRSWPVHSWAHYIQSRPPLVDTIDWDRPLTFILRGDAYPCAGGSWTQLCIGLLNHGKRGGTHADSWRGVAPRGPPSDTWTWRSASAACNGLCVNCHRVTTWSDGSPFKHAVPGSA